MTFLPSFHWPRFFKSSTRSKRFSTLRLAAMVLAPFKLRCCDIDSVDGYNRYKGKRTGTLSVDPDFSNGDHNWLLSTIYVPEAVI
jgi:hypothetical protein